MKADIIEEITRIYGYDNFDVNTAKSPLFPVNMTQEKTDEERIKDMLVKRYNLHEVHSYVWNYYDELKALSINNYGVIKLLNATNLNIETIRSSLIPTQLCQVKTNVGFAPQFGIFEIGRAVTGIDDNNLCIEKKLLTTTLYSKGDVKDLYFELKDIVETVVDELKHMPVTFKKAEPTVNYIHPVNYNAIICDGVTLGYIGIAHPTVSKKIDKRGAVVFMEIDIEKLASIKNASITYDEPSKFPTMDIDLSFVTDTFAPIRKAIEDAKCELIKKIEVVDIYEDENSKSITTRLTFSHPNKTLTREEVADVYNTIIDTLKSQGILLKG